MMFKEVENDDYNYSYDQEHDILRVRNTDQSENPFTYDQLDNGILIMIDNNNEAVVGAQVHSFLSDLGTISKLESLTDYPRLSAALIGIYNEEKNRNGGELSV